MGVNLQDLNMRTSQKLDLIDVLKKKPPGLGLNINPHIAPIFYSMPLSKFPRGELFIYSIDDITRVLKRGEYNLLPDLSTSIIWVDLRNCPRNTVMILKILVTTSSVINEDSEDILSSSHSSDSNHKSKKVNLYCKPFEDKMYETLKHRKDKDNKKKNKFQ